MFSHAFSLDTDMSMAVTEAQHREYLQMEMESEALMGDVQLIETIQSLGSMQKAPAPVAIDLD